MILDEETIVDFTTSTGLGLSLRPLPSINFQKRKAQATKSMHIKKICGADTETIDGKVWLFSTEFGVWEVETFADLILVLYNRQHASKWKSGRGDGRKSKRGFSTKEFFFWNLGYDVNAAVLRTIEPEYVKPLIDSEKVKMWVEIPGHGEVQFSLKYLEGKYLEIKPLNWMIGQYKVGVCKWWDISQYYGKQRLKNASQDNLGRSKIEFCFDGSVLDVGRLGEPEYRELYREDIEKYAVEDAALAGDLARLKRQHFIDNDIRFIQPYSLANTAQRALMDTCEVPTINGFTSRGSARLVLQRSLTAYAGGWFETSGSGYRSDVTATDLASAYPYVMYHLADSSAGSWTHGTGEAGWWARCEGRRFGRMGFAEAFVVFDEGLDYYPLVKKAKTGTLVAPRIIKGWFTMEELIEAKKWPHSTFVIGNWTVHEEGTSQNRPFAPFIERFYELKQNEPKGSVAYGVAKIMLNSVYGKLIQCVDDSTGKMWNPMYAATTTGATRARLAELIRRNGHTALSVATDGIVFDTDSFGVIPDRPAPAPHNLGQWEPDGHGELLVQMSGVYSVRTQTDEGEKTKTTFRGSAAYFLRGFREGGLFRFCEENASTDLLAMTVNKPWSAREGLIRDNIELINVFEERRFSINAVGDSTKRLWGSVLPTSFGSLLGSWFKSHPHRQVELVEYPRLDYAIMEQ